MHLLSLVFVIALAHANENEPACPPSTYRSANRDSYSYVCAACTAGYFCPGYGDMVACPAPLYVSPPAASSLANCTYLYPSNGRCPLGWLLTDCAPQPAHCELVPGWNGASGTYGAYGSGSDIHYSPDLAPWAIAILSLASVVLAAVIVLFLCHMRVHFRSSSTADGFHDLERPGGPALRLSPLEPPGEPALRLSPTDPPV